MLLLTAAWTAFHNKNMFAEQAAAWAAPVPGLRFRASSVVVLLVADYGRPSIVPRRAVASPEVLTAVTVPVSGTGRLPR